MYLVEWNSHYLGGYMGFQVSNQCKSLQFVPAGLKLDFSLVFSICIVISSKYVIQNLKNSLPHSIFGQFIIKIYQIKDNLQENLYLCDLTVKFCLEHPQRPLQIFQMNKRAGRFGLVKPGHPSKVGSICLIKGSLKKKSQVMPKMRQRHLSEERGLM